MTEQFAIIPYARVDGVPTLPAALLQALQERMRSEGLERWLLFDSVPAPALESIAVSGAVRFFSVVVDKKKPPGHPAALFWLTDGPGQASLIHFCIFREYWGGAARAIGAYVLKELLSMTVRGEALYPVIMGMPPDFNVHAVRYARDIGMTLIGTVPNVFYDPHEGRMAGAAVLYITSASVNPHHSTGG